tara:strand:- start:36399 stop:36575 length:177 start_codon:yes stop_codon:yes gene_type:complete
MLFKLDNSFDIKEIGRNPQTTDGTKLGNLFENGEGYYKPPKKDSQYVLSNLVLHKNLS